MKTIYDRLFMDDIIFTFDNELDLEITSNLITLLNISCGIDLSKVDDAFSEYNLSLDEFGDLEISYKFPYGKAYIIVHSKKDAMNVSFSFNSKFPICRYKERVAYLSVDNDMGFEKLELKHIINYVDTHRFPVWAALLVDTELDKSLKKTHNISYQNFKMFTADEDNIINLFDEGLNPYFLSPSDDFDDVFIYFLNIHEKYQDLFYEIFPEQNSYLDLMSSHTQIIIFLNMFYEQYHENKDLIKSRLSLLEMRLI
jgi:hypothetical protein